MFIDVGEQSFEINTKLGTAQRIEARFKLPLGQLFAKLDTAEINELTDILAIAAGKTGDEAKEFKAQLLEHWDYSDLYNAVQEMVARLMFSGTPEQNEAKISKYPVPDEQKNVIRGLLGLPIPTIPEDSVPKDSTGNEL